MSVILVVYLLFIRDFRSYLNKKAGEFYQIEMSETEGIKQVIRPTQIWVYHSLTDQVKIYTFKFPFGYFFILGLAGLVLIGGNYRLVFILVGIHALATVLNIFALWIGIMLNPYLFSIMDLISRYLLPLSSLGLVAFGLLEKKRRIAHEA